MANWILACACFAFAAEAFDEGEIWWGVLFAGIGGASLLAMVSGGGQAR